MMICSTLIHRNGDRPTVIRSLWKHFINPTIPTVTVRIIKISHVVFPGIYYVSHDLTLLPPQGNISGSTTDYARFVCRGHFCRKPSNVSGRTLQSDHQRTDRTAEWGDVWGYTRTLRLYIGPVDSVILMTYWKGVRPEEQLLNEGFGARNGCGNRSGLCAPP